MPRTSFIRQDTKNFLTFVRGQVGSPAFRYLYVIDEETGHERDVLENGSLSCAYFVSMVLCAWALIEQPHATVTSTLADIERSGWTLADEPLPGCVVYWPKGEDGHAHIGFYLGNGRYISNSDTARTPVLHDASLRDGRLPQSYYIHTRI